MDKPDALSDALKAGLRTRTPECDRLLAIHPQSQAIGEFLEWIDSRGWRIARYEDFLLRPVQYTAESLLAEFFGIDLDKVEAEKRALLDDLRRQQVEVAP